MLLSATTESVTTNTATGFVAVLCVFGGSVSRGKLGLGRSNEL
ncbi:MAG: hypothetical protein KatS3mg060_2701 [Dehalococcoidia bacterium]|nr:MAG: hypothetical protein KatS3mg060_2701 [Dehalococcoidia bacterium]